MDVERELLEVVLKKDKAEKTLVKLMEVASAPAVKSGENYASAISRVKITALLGNGRTIKTAVIVKRLPEEEKAQECIKSFSLFDTEIKMYADILPEMESILREHRIPPLWPEYLGRKNNLVIFQDLKTRNYSVCDRVSRLNLEHTLLALINMATFHAGSVILRERGLLDPTDLKSYFFLREEPEKERLLTGGVRLLSRVMKEEWNSEWHELADRLEAGARGCYEQLKKAGEVNQTGFNVLNHGDLWTTNMMFKYTRHSQQPIGLKFIDFQLAHYNSSAFDLIYFLLGSVRPEVRREHRTLLLQTYVDTVTEILTDYGYPGLSPTLKQIQAELERLDIFYFLIACSITPIMVTEADAAFDLGVLYSEDKDLIAQSPEIYRGEKFKEEHAEKIRLFAEKGFF